AWNTVTIPTTTVSANTTYWIAVLGPSGTGTLAYRDTTGGTKTEASRQTTLSDLPTSWTAGAASSTAPLSAYATVRVATPLFGDTAIAPNQDQQPAGVAEAFRSTSTTSGTTNQISLYLDAGSTAPQVSVGLYADSSGTPGSLLATGTVSSPVAGAWNLVTIPSTAISANTPYWIAILDSGSTGAVAFRDTAGGGASVTSSSGTLTSLPATWSSGSSFSTSPLSAYVALVGGSTTTTYTYDPVGNRLTKNATGYTYDRADRILTAGSTSDTVNANGNLTNRGTDTFAYDQANRLTGATVSGVTSTNTYDGDGKRASQTVGSTTTSYPYDVNGSLPNVLTDGTFKYIYGLGLAYAVDSSGNVQVYHTDGLGSVRAITDGSGNLIQTDETDEFGIPTSPQGTSPQPFGYTGQQADGNGLVYLRARYYDPTSGRFLSQDPLRGAFADPQTLNPYAYAGNNPPTLADPTGLDGEVPGLEGAVEGEGAAIERWMQGTLPGFETVAPSGSATGSPAETESDAALGQGQVPYGATDLSQKAIAFRLESGGYAERNVAVFEYDVGGDLTYEVQFSVPRVKPAEQAVWEKLAYDRVTVSQVTRIYSELEPCSPGGCKEWIASRFPGASTSWSFEYNSIGRLARLKAPRGLYR
ncbi:MAG: RHS repeat-associated core domain-containing protein, partial [Chloroflexota bacterium]